MTATEKELILGRRRLEGNQPGLHTQKVGGAPSITEAAEGTLLTSLLVSSYAAVTEYLTENL